METVIFQYQLKNNYILNKQHCAFSQAMPRNLVFRIINYSTHTLDYYQKKSETSTICDKIDLLLLSQRACKFVGCI